MNHRASVFGRGYGDYHRDSVRIRFRRAVTMCLLTIVFPGTAQMLLGNKWIGRIAFALWCILLGGLGYLAFQVKVDQREVLDLATNADVLQALRITIIVVAVAWVLLLIDAWRLVAPLKLPKGRAVLVTAINIAVIASGAVVATYATSLVHVQRDVVTTVFHGQKTSNPLHGRYNVLLLGSDSGAGRTGVRPDSMMVASVDGNTGKTVLIGLPRNLQNVPFDDDSPMHDEYPDGFNCGSECLLNSIHTEVEDRDDLYPDSDDPSMDATIDAVSAVTDLKINYHIVINMKGMRDLIDAVGGVTMDVEDRIAMFGQEDAWKDEYIDPGRQELDGKEALWYARSRVDSDDFTRMARQKCLMAGMLEQLSPQKVLTHATDIGESSKALLSTDIPGKELGQFADLALKSRKTQISSVSLVPPEVDVADPDYDVIQDMIKEAIEESEETSDDSDNSKKSDDAESEDTPSPGSQTDSDGDSDDDDKDGANETSDLTGAC